MDEGLLDVPQLQTLIPMCLLKATTETYVSGSLEKVGKSVTRGSLDFLLF